MDVGQIITGTVVLIVGLLITKFLLMKEAPTRTEMNGMGEEIKRQIMEISELKQKNVDDKLSQLLSGVQGLVNAHASLTISIHKMELDLKDVTVGFPYLKEKALDNMKQIEGLKEDISELFQRSKKS